jgi:hypothetical protein
VDPTATLPNVTDAGLTLSVLVLPELFASELAALAELPFALVMPEQPVKIATLDKRRTTQKIAYKLRQIRQIRSIWALRAHPSCPKN